MSKSERSTFRLVWRGVICRVTHERNYISKGWSHLELRVVSPNGRPLPITDTGYRSHFLDEDDLYAAGGPVSFFRAWLDREANGKAYLKSLAKWRQLDLFAPSA